MFKFLLYLVLFYFVIRFLRGLFQTNITIKNYHYGQKPDDKEGNIKIVGGAGKKKGGNKTDNLGEYVDYEDVK